MVIRLRENIHKRVKLSTVYYRDIHSVVKPGRDLNKSVIVLGIFEF